MLIIRRWLYIWVVYVYLYGLIWTILRLYCIWKLFLCIIIISGGNVSIYWGHYIWWIYVVFFQFCCFFSLFSLGGGLWVIYIYYFLLYYIVWIYRGYCGLIIYYCVHLACSSWRLWWLFSRFYSLFFFFEFLVFFFWIIWKWMIFFII